MMGELTFAAYCRARNNKDHTGQEIPAWENVKPEIKLAWEAAALGLILWWETEGRSSEMADVVEAMKGGDHAQLTQPV